MFNVKKYFDILDLEDHKDFHTNSLSLIKLSFDQFPYTI